jgi:CRISPR-associated endonuclease Csn1
MNDDYLLGLDLGTNSLGWAILDLNAAGIPIRIRRMGVRIFSDGRDPQSGLSLASDRTRIRGQRTRRDRALQRREVLLERLRALKLFPEQEEQTTARNLATLDPYALRARAVHEPLHPFHLGRALLHLAKRRGFLSNRRTPAKSEEGNTKEAMSRLRKLLSAHGATTLGELLHHRIKQGLSARFRPSAESAAKPKKEFELYPERSMYAQEFSAIRDAQMPHQKLSPKEWNSLENLIFFQRPLRKPALGRCRFFTDQPRAYLALQSFQEFRIHSDANHLAYRVDPLMPEQRLTDQQRETLLGLLRTQKTLKFSKLRNKLGLPDTTRFNLESDRRDALLGDPIAILFSGKKLFGARWHDLSLQDRDAILTAVLETEDHATLQRIAQQKWGLDGSSADTLAALSPDDLPKGTARFCAAALHRLVPEMAKGKVYSEAVAACGWNHTLSPENGRAPNLPYYGQAMPDSVVLAPRSKVEEEKLFGRIGNPTVHIALNQLRLVVNSLIARYGKPAQIALELARDLKLTIKQRAELEREQSKNTKINDALNQTLRELGQKESYGNRLRLRLWEEQKDGSNHFCPYTGKTISQSTLFSSEIEIDHILPFAATLDDSPANKILCLREANRAKRKRSPHEAFGAEPAAYAAILDRASFLPGNKRWRFQADAMDKFRDQQGFLARQLTDTQYLGRAAARYLTCICPKERIRVFPGRLTALLRHHWGLDSILDPEGGKKNRSDHRHHAIDALVVALADVRMLRLIQQANEVSALDEISIPSPWESMRTEADSAVSAIVVSHRPDHNPAGRLHEETAYGEVRTERRRPHQQWEITAGYNLVVRKPLGSLKRADLDTIRDLTLRQKLERHLEGIADNDKTIWPAALSRFTEQTGTRTVRLLKKDVTARIIRHGQGRFEKRVVPGLIHSVTFWQYPDGRIKACALSVWDANQCDLHAERPHPAAHKLFTVHKGDLVRTMHKGELKTTRVFSIRPSLGNELLACCPHTSSKTDDGIFIKFSRILVTQTRLVHVSPIGEVHDPGPLA